MQNTKKMAKIAINKPRTQENPMTLKHLNTFLTLTKEQSFTKAAVRLNCAQSGVTTHIKQLESELGIHLFERIGKHISLTPEGEALIPYAQKMLSLSGEIETLYQKPKRLTVGVTEAVANYLLGNIVKEYTALCPDTEIFFRMTDHRDYCQMLCDGELDLAIVLDTPVRRAPIRVLHKHRESILLAASSTHELSGGRRIQPEELGTFPLLLPAPDCPYRILFEQKLAAEGLRPKTALSTDSIPIIKEMVLCGTGLGLLPEFAVKKELIYHMLEKISFRTDFAVYTQLLIHPDKWISPQLEQFLEVAGRHLGQVSSI